MGSECNQCGTCKYWDKRYNVRPKKLSSGLTEMGGTLGYCMAMEENADEMKYPIWLYEVLSHMESPLTRHEYGQFCRTWEALGDGEPLGDPQDADHA